MPERPGILDHIGRTPLVRLQHIDRDLPVPILAKCEHLNPGGSVKDRIAKPHHNASCMRKAFIRCLEQANIGRGFSSHGLRRTANDLLRRVASGEVTRSITGHVTQEMTEHYSHVDAAEKRAAVDGMLRLVREAAAKQETEQESEGQTGRNEKGRLRRTL